MPSDRDAPIHCTTERHVTIAGRGTVHLLRNPFDTTSLRMWMRRPIILDGRSVTVFRVEGFCKNGQYRRGDLLGLILTPENTNSPQAEDGTTDRA